MANGTETKPKLNNREIVELYNRYNFPTPDRNDLAWIRDNLPTTKQELENILREQKRRMEDDTGIRTEDPADRRWLSPADLKDLQQKYSEEEIKQITETTKNEDGTSNYYLKENYYNRLPNDQLPANSTLTENQVKEQFNTYGYQPTQEDIKWWTNRGQNELSNLQQNLSDRRQNEIKAEKDAALSGGRIVGKPFFQGDEALVRFAEEGGGGIWSVNPETKRIRPILSREAFENRYEMTPEEAIREGVVKTVSENYFERGAPLEGFKKLSDRYGVQESGEYTLEEGEDKDRTDQQGQEFDPARIMNTYGKNTNERLNREAFKAVNGGLLNWLNNMEEKDNGGISKETINSISNNPEVLATYVNALAYGDYNVNDVYRDLKRRELIRQGEEEYKDIKVIDETTKASDFYKNENQKAIRQNQELIPPEDLGGIDTGLLENPIFDVPNDVYQTLVEPFDWNSKEGKEALDEIKSSYHDVILQQLEASTEQERVRAEEAYRRFQEDIEKEYGIKLSDSADKAWGKIRNLEQQITKGGIRGSGIANEMRQQYLKDVRTGNERLREAAASEEEAEEKEYLQRYGTPEEITALSEEEKERYGFKPSAETREFFSKEKLKERYPDLSDRQIEEYRNSILDEEGNYRSKLYQDLWMNKKETREDKRTYQLGDVSYDEETGEIIGGRGALYKKALESEKAYEPFEKSGPFEKPKTEEETTKADDEDKRLPTRSREQARNNPGYRYVDEEEYKRETSRQTTPEKEKIQTSFGEQERDMDAERRAVDEFIKERNRKPTEQKDWDVVHERAYKKNDNQQTAPKQKADSAWEGFKKEHSNRDWSGYEKISSPSDIDSGKYK
ncbi:MAG: hypothetical protein ACOCTT_03810, partial [archaeon]